MRYQNKKQNKTNQQQQIKRKTLSYLVSEITIETKNCTPHFFVNDGKILTLREQFTLNGESEIVVLIRFNFSVKLSLFKIRLIKMK